MKQKKGTPIKQDNIRIILISMNILLFCIAFGFLFNIVNPLGIETKESEKAILIPIKQTIIDYTNELEYLDLRSAKKYYNQGKANFLDARTEYAYKEGHIKGAYSIPFEKFEEQYEKINKIINNGNPLVIYCNNELCSLSERVAILLKKKKYKHIKIFSGGWAEWESAKYPIEKGSNDDGQKIH